MSDPKKTKPSRVKSDEKRKSEQNGPKTVKKSSNTGSYGRQPMTRRQGPRAEKDRLAGLLEGAFKAFSSYCSNESAVQNREGIDDVRKSDEASELELEFEEFERAHLPNLKQALPSETQGGVDTLLHIMVNKWSKDAWSLEKNRFLGWMLKHQEFRDLLTRENQVNSTPMHAALSKKLDEFVNCVLEAPDIGSIATILGKDNNSVGNCFHIAIRQNFPYLESMIDRCAGSIDLLVFQNRSDNNTPLHLAVNELSLPVLVDDPSEFDAVQATLVESGEDPGTGPTQNDEISGEVNIADADFSQDLDEDDSDFEPNLEDADDHGDSDGQVSGFQPNGDPEITWPEVYRLEPETDQERRKRLSAILRKLEEEAIRPKPTPMPRSQRTDTLTPSPTAMHLPPSHNVRLLVEANPEALQIRNQKGRTPYQEREEVLLRDPIAQKVISEYISQYMDNNKWDSDDDSSSTENLKKSREKWAKRMIVVHDPVAYYIRSFCLRNSKSREETMSRLYQPGKEYHIEFDLAGMPNTVISQEYLDQLSLHLKFESILKYVALPALSIERQSPSNNANSRISQNELATSRNGCSDLVVVFDWLWRNGVREVIKVMVVDDRDQPHADTAIIEALYGFKVEEWDWKRVDLCSDVIYEASPTVREVSLYCSGNNAVLMGWASSEGLGNRKKFPRLERVNIYVRNGLEDSNVQNRNTDRCKASIEEHDTAQPGGRGIQVKIIPDNNKASFTSEFYNATDGREHPWIESIQNFSSLLKAASNPVTPVKIAIIDDGIDGTVAGLQSKIAGGASFYPNQHSSELVNSYFVPSGKHGTLMAQLICRLCPDVQLYIARLEELPSSTGSGRRVTARSAAKAVDWAINCGVNIISMSWTIQTMQPEHHDMIALRTALNLANTKNILMFCSASDQGGHTTEHSYPADYNQCLRIGGATFAGDKLTWVNDKVDFWFPGKNVPFPSSDMKTVVYESGSSVATAAASGLAAVLIYAARLVYGNDTGKFQSREQLHNAFEKMASGSDKKFPRTNEILGTKFKDQWWKEKIRKAPSTQRGAKGLSIETLSWDDVSKKAVEELLDYIQSQAG